jgi:hypothetical protein
MNGFCPGMYVFVDGVCGQLALLFKQPSLCPGAALAN